MSDIQRYAPWPQEWPVEDPNGDLVTYEDHKKIVDALEAKVKKLRKERDDALTFLDNAVSKAPEPLKALGKYLAGRLDEDEWPTAEQYLNAAAKACADHTEAAEAEVEKLRRAAAWQEKQRRDAFARRHINAPEDPHVAALCERYGYGAVMDAASRLWARKDSVGAFYIGGCIGIKPDAALTTEADNG